MRVVIFLGLVICLISCGSGNIDDIKCRCQDDLEFVYRHLKKTPSFKQQIKDKPGAFMNVLDSLRNEALEVEDLFQCFSIISAMLDQVKDNHLLFSTHFSNYNTIELRNPVTLSKLKNSLVYGAYPISPLDLDSLERELCKVPISKIEGIYTYRSLYKMALYADNSETKFRGVILESPDDIWQRGEVIIQLKKIAPNYFRVMVGDIVNKNLIRMTELISDGYFHSVAWNKFEMGPSYARGYLFNKNYSYGEISDTLGILRLPDFKNESYLKAKKFYERIHDQLDTENLLVDIRFNPGGTKKVSDLFMKPLQSYALEKNLYILQNFGTKSKAEQFSLQLSRIEGVKILGSRSNGSLSYGWKGGSLNVSPSGLFSFRPTNLDYSMYLENEDTGVIPDIMIPMGQYQYEQVIDYILKEYERN